MPVHRCTSRALDEKVAEIEAGPERIVSVNTVGSDTYVIITYLPTRTAPKGRETR